MRIAVTDPLLTAKRSQPFTIIVRALVTLELEKDELSMGETVVAHGDLIPEHPAAHVVLEYRRPEGTWVPIDEEIVGTDGYEMSFVPPASGIWEVQVRATSTGDEDHEPSVSGTRLISVVSP